MTQTQSGYADLGDTKLYYEMAGTGETLVFAHAGFLDSRMWDSQWDFFKSRYRVLRFDMRGFGKSDVAQAPVSRRDDLYRLLKHLDITNASFVGCSMSGEAILDLALEHPDMVKALIPVSAAPSGFEMQGEPPRYLMDMIGALQAGDVEQASELQIRIWVDGSFREPHEVDSGVRQHAADMNRIAVRNNTWFIADMQPPNPLTPPAITRLREITAPTLAIAGMLDNPEILRAAREIAAGIPGAKQHIIPDAAHVPNMEHPDEFNQIVLDFLQGVA